MSFFDKLKDGLKKTKNAVFGQVDKLFRGFVKVDEELLEELEEILIMADVGAAATETILDRLRDRIRAERLTDPLAAKEALMLFGVSEP